MEYVIGAESRAETGEPHAPDGPAQPGNQQGVTHCFALSYHPGEDHTIERPDQYDFWRAYQAPFWPGPHLGWSDLHPTTLEARTFSLFGPSDDPERFMTRDQFVWGQQGLWHYRRLRHRANLPTPARTSRWSTGRRTTTGSPPSLMFHRRRSAAPVRPPGNCPCPCCTGCRRRRPTPTATRWATPACAFAPT